MTMQLVIRPLRKHATRASFHSAVSPQEAAVRLRNAKFVSYSSKCGAFDPETCARASSLWDQRGNKRHSKKRDYFKKRRLNPLLKYSRKVLLNQTHG
ncbi:hypothetical protein M408DRAFT_134147 [Serendipita vermifera MAFF 305830]|uniref:Uncharacterized protein n=1 Tax=Serendipita vermifera MAFF 305830 TaxID=933852 RepID=A0A0C3AWE5_SERVB|nr:hypothetical protein M408DRAFT_134147 [Serendipita vermifera MAFF 305830]